MAEILTDSEIAEIEARANLATEGPWQPYYRVSPRGAHKKWHIGNETGLCQVTMGDHEQDYEFMAHARTDIPRLIASHRALAAQLANIEEREAAVCPEDVGFDEYIRALAAERDNDLRNRQHCEDEVHDLKQRLQVKTELLDKAMAQVCAENTAKVELEAQVRELTEERQQVVQIIGGKYAIGALPIYLQSIINEYHQLGEAVESFRERAVRAIRAKAEEWRHQGERWQQKFARESNEIIKRQDLSDRDCAFNQMQAATALASLVESLPLEPEQEEEL